jgi:DNA-directed RNA polymerase specialized sigma24 family protein
MLKRRRALTQEGFDQLLAWLDSDSEQAAIRYETIRVSLIRILTWRGSNNADDLADETINRVAEKVHLLKNTFVGDPAIYFYAVAKRLFKEEQRSAKAHVSLGEGDKFARPFQDLEETTDECLYDCLASCLRDAGTETEKMILTYYSGEGQVRITNRKALAQQLGIPLNALRVRMHRIRSSLEMCLENCIRNERKLVKVKTRNPERKDERQ